MARTLKVFACNLDGKSRGIVAATSKSAAAILLGVSYHTMNTYGGQTWNEDDVAVAMSEPGVPFKQSYEMRDTEFIRIPPRPQQPEIHE